MRTIRPVLAPAFLAALAAPALAATISVPRDHDTIQAAVDAASPGDRIVVGPGTYYENVTVSKARLTLVAKRATIDGTVAATPGTCVTVLAEQVTVQGFSFRNGRHHVEVNAPGARILRCTSRAAERSFVYAWTGMGSRPDGLLVSACRSRSGGNGNVVAYADDVAVLGTTFLNGDDRPVVIRGDHARVERCVVRSIQENGFDVDGDDAVVRSNRLLDCSGDGIGVQGARARIERNDVRMTMGRGILVYGDDATVSANAVAESRAHGVEVQGARAVVAANRVQGSHQNGIWVRGADATVTDNRVEDSGTWGIGVSPTWFDPVSTYAGAQVLRNVVVAAREAGGYLLAVDNSAVMDNRAEECGVSCDPGFFLYGTLVTFARNVASLCEGGGFVVQGDRNVLSACRAESCDESGFSVRSGNGNALDGCTATDCSAQGLLNRGAATEVRRSSFLGNRLDVCEASGDGFAVFTGNRYGERRDGAPDVDCRTR